MPRGRSTTTAMVGEVFGRLTVIGYGERDHLKRIRRVCRCECGTLKEVLAGKLMNGETRSCGCLIIDVLKKRNDERPLKYENGYPEGYHSWRGIIQRCCNPECKDYPRYGGRGITVCERWKGSLDAFIEDMGVKPEGMTIDRIDNSGNYEPGNCRWTDAKEQANNRRSNVTLEFNGETMTVSEWARKVGLKVVTLEQRLRRGWSVEKALTSTTEK